MLRKKWFIVAVAVPLIVACIIALTGFSGSPEPLAADRDIFGTFVLREENNNPPTFASLSGQLAVTVSDANETWAKRFQLDEAVILETEEDRDALIAWLEQECPVPQNPDSFAYLINQIRERVNTSTLEKKCFAVLLTKKYFSNRCYTEGALTNQAGEVSLTVSEIGGYDVDDWGPFYSLIFIGLSREDVKTISSLTKRSTFSENHPISVKFHPYPLLPAVDGAGVFLYTVFNENVLRRSENEKKCTAHTQHPFRCFCTC